MLYNVRFTFKVCKLRRRPKVTITSNIVLFIMTSTLLLSRISSELYSRIPNGHTLSFCISYFVSTQIILTVLHLVLIVILKVIFIALLFRLRFTDRKHTRQNSHIFVYHCHFLFAVIKMCSVYVGQAFCCALRRGVPVRSISLCVE